MHVQVRVTGEAALADIPQVVTLLYPAPDSDGARDGSVLHVHQVDVVVGSVDLNRDGVTGAVVVARARAVVAAEVRSTGTNRPDDPANRRVDRLAVDGVAPRVGVAPHVEVVGVDEGPAVGEVLVIALHDADAGSLLERKEGERGGVSGNRGRGPGVRAEEKAENGQGQCTPSEHLVLPWLS